MGKIIWLASYPKSGNTWVRAFLANLFSGTEAQVDINALDRFCSTLSARSPYDEAAGGSTMAMSEHEILRMRKSILREFCETFAESAFIKTHSRFGDQFGLPLIHPEFTAGAIYIVRNPLDVVISAASHFGVSVVTMAGCMADPEFRIAASEKHVTEFIGTWSGNVASWTIPSHPKIHVVRYEDLCEFPRAEFERLTTFLGLGVSEERFTRALEFSQFDVMSRQERNAGFKERPSHAREFFRRGRPGEGRETLHPALVEAIVSEHREQMARFGYL